MGNDDRANFGAEEMIGAGRAQGRQGTQHFAIHKFQNLRGIGEMAGLHFILGNAAAYFGQQAQNHGLSFGRTERFDGFAAKGRLLAILVEPGGGFVDDAKGCFVAFLRGFGPGEQAVAAKNDAHIFRVFGGHLAKLYPEIDAGALPRQIAHLISINLFGELFGIL